jgi:hypothetical protein
MPLLHRSGHPVDIFVGRLGWYRLQAIEKAYCFPGIALRGATFQVTVALL